jgi:CubicO group peptidase (beta-lactamase class C family)
MVPRRRRRLAALAAGVLLGLTAAGPSRPAAAQPATDPLPRAAPEAVGMSSERLARLTGALQAEVDRGQIPGAVVAVARRGRLVLHEAVGFLDREAGTPMPRDAIFAVASLTKPWVGAAALMLAEEGRLTLGDPVERFLPQLGGRRVAVLTEEQRAGRGEGPIETVPARRPVTVQDLLRHTAGLTYGRAGTTALHRMYPPSSQWASENLGADEFLARLAALPLHHQPGTAWEYGLGIDVAGLVVERVSGRSLGAFLEERLFRPLGMADSSFLIPPEKAGRTARPQAADPDTRRRPEVPDRTRPVRFECGGGCGASTAGDYLRFAQALLDGGRLGDARVLAPRSVRAMVSEQLPAGARGGVGGTVPNLEGYGFGLTVAVRPAAGGPPVLGSPGDFAWPGAYGTTFWVDPLEGLAVVFMAQTSWPRLGHNWRLVNGLVYQAIAE